MIARQCHGHRLVENEVTTEERAEYVHDVLVRRRQVAFFDLVTNVPLVMVVITFIAVLELVRESLIDVVQNESYGPIHVRASASAARRRIQVAYAPA